MNLIVFAFYVDECMNFKVFQFPLFSVIYEIETNKSNLNGFKEIYSNKITTEIRGLKPHITLSKMKHGSL
jgi:hypothetical protein